MGRPPRRSHCDLLVLLVVGVGLGGCFDPGLPCADCNVILISIDTLRADHLSLYGYSRRTTPQLEELANEAIVFDDFVNNGGTTLPVHISMLTSLTPGVHRILPQSGRSLEPGRVTLAEQMRAAGYATAAFTDGGWVRGTFGFDQGFDVFDDRGGGLLATLPKAERWLAERRSQPFFLFLHTYDVHSRRGATIYDCPGTTDDTLYAPSGYNGDLADGCVQGRCGSELLVWLNRQILDGQDDPLLARLSATDLAFLEARYDGCIQYVDEALGGFFARLRERRQWRRTVLAVTADHGEEFLEHGLLTHMNLPYEEMVRVPLIVKLPASRFGGSRVGALASTIDLMPTLLASVGIGAPAGAMGVSLLPLLQGASAVRDEVHTLQSMRGPRWKLIKSGKGLELYDLSSDPGERLDLAGRHRRLARQLARALARARRADDLLREAMTTSDGAVLASPTPEEVDELEALGYVQ